MPRYTLLIREIRYVDAHVDAESPADARYKYERSLEPDATFEEMDAIEIGDGEVTDWSIEEVIEQ